MHSVTTSRNVLRTQNLRKYHTFQKTAAFPPLDSNLFLQVAEVQGVQGKWERIPCILTTFWLKNDRRWIRRRRVC